MFFVKNQNGLYLSCEHFVREDGYNSGYLDKEFVFASSSELCSSECTLCIFGSRKEAEERISELSNRLKFNPSDMMVYPLEL